MAIPWSADATLIDLSIGLEDGVPSEPAPPSITRFDHEAGAKRLAAALAADGYDVPPEAFPDGYGLAWEHLEVSTHAGTHMDAPLHYGPESGGEPAGSIDDVPLEWCLGTAVVLDVTHLPAGAEIGPADIDEALAAADHTLSAGEIVLLETGGDDLWGDPAYLTDFPGLGAAGTHHLLDAGVRVIGTDAYGLDKPFAEMGRRYAETGDPAELWPAHRVGRDRPYCQIEKLANLDALPRRTDIPLVAVPVLVEGATAGWVRPVAVLEAGTE